LSKILNKIKMKKLITLSIALLAIYTANAQTTKAKTKDVKAPTSKSKDADGIDGRMKGPKGEAIYIGDKGGRYYINEAGNKVYVAYKGNDKKSEKKAVTKAVKAVVGK
jgi:hypothetical protein